MSITDLRNANPRCWRMASALRALAMDAVQKANSGHPGMPMGMADVATVLFDKHLKFDPTAPDWPDRDRFVLSAGHGSILLYGLLHLSGYLDMTIDEIKNFRQMGARTAGHPEYGHATGIETTTGPLGQGLSSAVGMALAERMLAARYGDGMVDHRTYVIVGDGCLMEGISQEAISLAGHLGLSKLIVLWDDNGISIDGALSLSDSTDQLARFRASGWDAERVDGHDYADIDAAIKAAKRSGKPSLIACKTVIGYGTPTKQGTSATHGAPLGDEEIAASRKALGWTAAPFEIPAEIRADWAAVGARGAAPRTAWQGRMAALPARKRAEFERVIAGDPPAKLTNAVRKYKKQLIEDKPSLATRKASENALAIINPIALETIGGSADLTGSNNTKTRDQAPIQPGEFAGRYVYYGIREHAMAAAMNGIALHGGFIPYGGTFLVFTDYARGAMRLSALMGQRVIYVMTHDSIGLGEDGPTHQPVEHLAMLRATPNMRVFRPADAVETLEAWELALTTADAPSTLALTRQTLPTLRAKYTSANRSAQGAYVLAEAEGKRRAILLATGSEVEIVMAARDILQAEGIGTRVVSMPCWELFEAQPEAYRKRVLPRGPVRVGVEAAARLGWDRWLSGENGDSRKSTFVGMESFGASAPYRQLYAHFGITAGKVAEAARALL